MKTFPDLDINNLTETTFIGGTYKQLVFNMFTVEGEPLDLTSGNVTWTLCPYEQQDFIVLSKTAVCSLGHATVTLFSTDTLTLRGKYIQKPTINGAAGHDYKIGQGIINIIPALGGTNGI